MRQTNLFIICALLTGCATQPTSHHPTVVEQKASIGLGEPLTIDYKEICTRYLLIALKDPESAKIIWLKKPYEGYIQYGPDSQASLASGGYFVDVLVNSKNSYGAYAGYTSFAFHFRNNKLKAVKSSAEWVWI